MTTNIGGGSDASAQDLLVLGETDFRDRHDRFGLLPEARLRHCWILGMTGSGKSTLIANMVRQDLAAGRGLALIDPHGDLYETVLPFVPRERMNRVVLFDPEDREHVVAFNIFRRGRQMHPDPSLLASQLLSVFKARWGATSWGPRLEHVLRQGIMAIAGEPRATLLFLYRFLTEEDLRERVVAGLSDPVVRQFWTKEFPGYSKTLQGDALAPVQNKLGAFVSSEIVRGIVSQERSRVDLLDLMANRGVLLAKLPTGTIGEDASHLLGGLLLSAIQLAAMERPRGGPPFAIYVDEFQNFVTDSVATMLSEARKFGVSVNIAHQFLGQLTPLVRDAVLGNVGTSLVFRLGGADAEILTSEFSPEFDAHDLERLERYRMAVKLVARGEALHPFSARTLALPAPPPDAAEIVAKVRAQSRSRYASPRAAVQAAIERQFGRSS